MTVARGRAHERSSPPRTGVPNFPLVYAPWLPAVGANRKTTGPTPTSRAKMQTGVDYSVRRRQS